MKEQLFRRLLNTARDLEEAKSLPPDIPNVQPTVRFVVKSRPASNPNEASITVAVIYRGGKALRDMGEGLHAIGKSAAVQDYMLGSPAEAIVFFL